MHMLKNVSRLQDRLTLALGVLLFLSPWLLQFTDMRSAAINAWLCGVAVSGLATAALLTFKPWEQWYGVGLGVWIIAAPWVLGFAPVMAMTATHTVIGLLLVACATWEIWQIRHPTAA